MKTFTKISTDLQTVGGRFKRQIVIKKFTTDDGIEHEFTTWGNEGSRSGAVIALTPDKKVITTYQFRGGPERWMYELPGGNINAGEDAQAGVLRELKEETGYIPGKITLLGTSSRDAYINSTWYYFIATDCQLSAGGTHLDDTEHDQGVEVRLISIDELLQNALHDQMSDPHAVLMAYEKLKEMM